MSSFSNWALVGNCYHTNYNHQTDNSTEDNNLNTYKPSTLQEINSIIDSLPPKLSSGHDGISNKIIKHCKQELIHPLLNIINSSLAQSTVPSKMKIAIVYPKFKKGDKLNPENYRPISMLPTLSKCLEKIVFNRLINYLEQNNLLTTQQHGFRKGYSTKTAISHLCKAITKIWENKHTAAGLFIDLKKHLTV